MAFLSLKICCIRSHELIDFIIGLKAYLFSWSRAFLRFVPIMTLKFSVWCHSRARCSVPKVANHYAELVFSWPRFAHEGEMPEQKDTDTIKASVYSGLNRKMSRHSASAAPPHNYSLPVVLAQPLRSSSITIMVTAERTRSTRSCPCARGNGIAYGASTRRVRVVRSK